MLKTHTPHQWLTKTGSLTQHLRALTDNQIKHHLYLAQWGKAMDEECNALHIPCNSAVWLREIGWYYHEILWIFARVAIPKASLKKQSVLQHAGEQSLGDILFQDPALQRKLLPLRQLQASHPCHKRCFELTQHTHTRVWERRSLFYFHQQPLLVTEVFLPDFFNFLENADVEPAH